MLKQPVRFTNSYEFSQIIESTLDSLKYLKPGRDRRLFMPEETADPAGETVSDPDRKEYATGRTFSLTLKSRYNAEWQGMLSVIKTVRDRREVLPGKRKTEAVLVILTVAAFSACAYFLQADYGFLCPALAASFYLFYGREPYRTITGCALLFADREVFSVTAYIPIYFYNGEKGKSSRYFFYIFYPAHLMALWLLKRYAMNGGEFIKNQKNFPKARTPGCLSASY